MNIHELSIKISKFEGKKKSVNIAQIKEIIRILGVIFNEINICQFLKLAWNIKKHGKNNKI